MAAAVPLTPDEQANVDAGLCACGCAEQRPAGQARWAGAACSQRHYRQRRQTGRVVTFEERRRNADLARAAQLEAQARAHTAEADRQRTAARAAKREARTLRQKHAGQEALPLSDTAA